MVDKLPHNGVWARLGVSGIHGVGVFAIRPIPEGTDIFANDQAPLEWLGASILDDADMTTEERRLYADFSVRRGKELGCPVNFNVLSVGWYLNEPAAGRTANVVATADCRMIAHCAIAQGEELTVRYDTFSDRHAFP